MLQPARKREKVLNRSNQILSSEQIEENRGTAFLTDAQSFWMRYPKDMDHLAVLRDKIGSLRAEIAQLQELNDRYWLRGRHDTQAHAAHGQRHERLEAIQQELVQIAGLGLRSVEQMKDQHRSRPYLLKKVS